MVLLRELCKCPFFKAALGLGNIDRARKGSNKLRRHIEELGNRKAD